MVTTLVAKPAVLVEDGRLVCIVDARLVLSGLGPLAVARLTREFAVWLPRELREILRDARSRTADPGRLVPRVFCAPIRRIDTAAETQAISEALAQWDHLPENDELASLPLYYLGERADESFTPAAMDRGLRQRCEQLQAGLDLVMRGSAYDLPRGGAVAACVRDAVALCAALQPYGAFILTRLEADGEGAPALCNYLDAWDIPTQQAPSDSHRAVARLHEALEASGIAPIAWTGVQLAAVHVVLAGIPVAGGADERLSQEAVADLWSRADVFWHLV
jgi:hypothetical protein